MNKTPNIVADQQHFVPGKILRVDLKDNVAPSYDIVIGYNILSEAATLIRLRLGERRCIIITDTHVETLYRARLEAFLAAGGHDVLSSIVVPAGEANKNFDQLQGVLGKMMAAGLDRKTLVIALGGGVVGDMAGLAAALAMRGVDYVQIPTTLLAQVDSSVGGKTGIDTVHGKNTVGVFHQPRLVLIDVTLLDSLPARELRAGYAEIIKYGLIGDAGFYRWCLAHGAQLLSGDHDAQINAINVSCATKAKIVSEDEHESGIRALLNFGHTFGHALESATGYSKLLHGEAVALGMLIALRLSVRLGLCTQVEYDEVRAHFQSVGLPVALPQGSYDIDHLMQLMAQDKKAEAGKPRLILLRGIGKAFVARDTASADIRAVWQEFIA
jgi:3-dehydroquinate synthase